MNRLELSTLNAQFATLKYRKNKPRIMRIRLIFLNSFNSLNSRLPACAPCLLYLCQSALIRGSNFQLTVFRIHNSAFIMALGARGFEHGRPVHITGIVPISRNSVGERRMTRLNARVKCAGVSKPKRQPTSLMLKSVSLSNRHARSIFSRNMY